MGAVRSLAMFERWMNFCFMYLMVEPDFPFFFLLNNFFLSLSRSKLTAMGCVNVFAQKLRGASHHESWGLVLPFPSQT